MTLHATREMTETVGHPDWAIAAMVREWVIRKPDQPCLICAGTTRTWREVFDRTSRLAQGLVQADVEPHDRVMYLGKNRSEFFEILIGASMAGVVTAALNWRLAPREMRQILNHSRAKVLFVEAEFLGHIEQIRSQLTFLEDVIVIGEDAVNGYEAWLENNLAKDPEVGVAETDAAFQMYTSGTTGMPKGAIFSNAAVRASVAHADLMEVDEDAVVLVAMPVFHAVGSAFGTQALSVGGTCVIARDFVPETLLSLIEEHRITSAPLVPSALKMLLESATIESRDLSSLRSVCYSASPISPELLAAVVDRFDCSVVQLYGLTETSLATLLLTEDHLDPLHPERRLSCGRAVRGSTVRVIDLATGIDAAEGEFGEVWVKCSTQMSGYWDAPEETAATITPDGYIRTGDGGYLQDGYLYLKDRIKDMIVSGGENVYPVEVENVLMAHPGVNDVAVIGVPSEKWGETVKALVVRESSAPDLDATEIIAFAKQNLAGYKCPTSVEFLAQVPRNPSGKVLKRVLRERYA
jgi:long-chain acyl-CoA synthetase